MGKWIKRAVEVSRSQGLTKIVTHPLMQKSSLINAILELLGKSDQSGIPINIKEIGMRALKLLLLGLCIREAKWVGKHPNSLKLQRVPIEEFSQTFDYGLKDITKLDDFNQVVD